MARAAAPAAEVAWGETAEAEIVKRWLALSVHGRGAGRLIKSMDFDPYDFFLFGKRGMPICAVEVKKRRTGLGKYGDLMVPISKHEFALELRELFLLPFICVTSYGDGALVEVDLSLEPAERRDVKRRDRPTMDPVPHALYGKSQITVLVKPS